jgi:lysophospholipid acyltransferase (LPLAT)-like uncharacterized protein
MLKQLLGNPLVQFLIGRTIGLYMLLVGSTTRWTQVNRAAIEPFFTGGGKLVGCIWHGRFTLAYKMWAFQPGIPKAKMLISQSREGGIVAHASRTVGAEVIRGSAPKGAKRKGGFEAMRAMARHIEGGGVICMTPDGPRGPRMRAKLGPVQLAKLAGAPLIGVAWSTRNRKVFGSWDRFVLPLPFGRGALVWSDPIPAPAPDADAAEVERIRAKLEQELIRVTAEADRLAGAEVIEPAPAPESNNLEPATSAS